jgi:hypothetical protein
MRKVDLAYSAGLLDGEAYIGIKKSKPYKSQGRTTPGYHARIQVRMVDEPGVALLAELFGGHLYAEQPHCNNGRPLYCWALSDAKAEAAIRLVLPFLRVKAAQARIVLDLRGLQREGRKHRTKVTGHRNFPNKAGAVRVVENRCFSDEYVERCESYWMECRKLNGLARFQ